MSDPLDLEAIEARAGSSWEHVPGVCGATRADVQALLAEVKRLRADREKAREAFGKWLASVDGAEPHGLRCWNQGSGRVKGQPCVCGFADLRAALSEPPGEAP